MHKNGSNPNVCRIRMKRVAERLSRIEEENQRLISYLAELESTHRRMVGVSSLGCALLAGLGVIGAVLPNPFNFDRGTRAVAFTAAVLITVPVVHYRILGSVRRSIKETESRIDENLAEVQSLTAEMRTIEEFSRVRQSYSGRLGLLPCSDECVCNGP